MRRTLTLFTLATLALAACGGADAADTSDTTGEAPTTVAPSDSIPPVDDTGDTVPEPAPTTTSADKPAVEIPADVPAELVRTVLDTGTGEPAEDGDTVIVDYIGVRSVDGVEFDNSYDRGQPFPVTLGTGGVIPGWDEGLIGAQTGERVQLDIPSDLAYGPDARSEVIRENEALTFVIDVRVVAKAVGPEDVPEDPGVELSEESVEDTVFEDLVVGEGSPLEIDDTAVIRYVNFRGDNGVALETNWGPDPLQINFGENLLPGLLEGMTGMNVGGRRAVTIPPVDGFGEEGNPQGGLPAGIDMIFVIELLGTY